MSNESLLIKTLLARSCSSAELKTVSRVQNKKLWSAYSHFRDAELIHSAGGDVNEMLLFHGTAERPASDVLAHPQGLDPRFSKGGGFYGHGIYLAEDPSYPIGGRYAHRISGTDGRRVQLLVVRAALGSQQQMGQRISAETREMRMPGVRLEGPPRVLYDSVRGGPHRPFQSGGGDNGCDASIVHVVYESRQMYPAYVIEVEMEMGAEVAAAVGQDASEAAGPAPKRQRHAGPSNAAASSGSSSGSGLLRQMQQLNQARAALQQQQLQQLQQQKQQQQQQQQQARAALLARQAQHAAMIQKARAALVARQPAAAPHAAPPSTSSHSAAQVPAVRLRFLTDPDSSDVRRRGPPSSLSPASALPPPSATSATAAEALCPANRRLLAAAALTATRAGLPAPSLPLLLSPSLLLPFPSFLYPQDEAFSAKKPPPPKTAASKEKKPPPVKKAASKEKATASKQQANKPPPDSSDEEDQPLSQRKQK